MKLLKASVFCLLVAFSANTEMHAQKFSSLDKSPLDAAAYPASSKVTNKTMKVIYSRPQLNNRELYDLVPLGKVWRLGANESAEITFYKDSHFGDTPVKAGTYSLFAIREEKTWTLILNKDLNAWGAYSYNPDNDIARAKGLVSIDAESIEAFSIAFDEEGTMYLAWGTTRVSLPFKS
ncbi:DUF2911 domain-containing protein [Formosa algae]|uniref:Asparagine synthetase B n=1 Tax=Formosa algae TaxID=225843 RepID=A0A9X1C8S1_9FLAO|nr:DUF2911 domain-containing protein [Formosa algae]MBP1838923.1 hypothetical protein [Formosa algae]MDQ0333700.1 hypothetical protein [Formosa algae]OEI78884.1 asparagine synthetase B [Formosa algae]